MPEFRPVLTTVASALLAACSHSAITPDATDPAVPAEWARAAGSEAVDLNWLAGFSDPQLSALVQEAIDNNYQLQQERARLAQAEQAVIIVRADRFPELDLSLDGARRGVEANDGTRVTTTRFDATLDARWDVDIWGRLNKAQQSAQLELEAQRARLARAEREQAASTARLLYSALQARQLLEVAERRLENVEQSHEIVASGYRQGLNDALDLYLARNQVERQQANLAQQQQIAVESVADLQLALARYPDGHMPISGELPVINEPIFAGMPSQLLGRRADINESWLRLLAADASLAAAHKARFPRLTLLGSGGVSSLELEDLLDGDGASWSLIGGLTQPVFQGGRLQALESQAAERVRQVEQEYLELVFRAFADVENAISRGVSLRQRYEAFLDAETNSAAALTLALQQYQRGLVSYTTVLESQRQAFDAEATVVELRNQLLQNRIDLYLALGGSY